MNNIKNNSLSLVYLALSLISHKRNSILPELLFILNTEELVNFVNLFGGERIYIPKPEELNFYLLCSICAYYRINKNKTWLWISNKLNIDKKEMRKIKRYIKNWSESTNKDEINLIKYN